MMSVIIPVRNDASRLARCLDSLAQQDYPADRFEIIVVDNGSADDSAAVAAAKGAIVLHHPGLRVGALRNRGAQVARGAVLAFVDSDHEVPRHWLRVAAQELTNDNNALMIGSPYAAPPSGTWVQRNWELHRTRGERRRRVDWLGAGNMFLRRRDFLQVHGFDENLVAAEDVDLCVRLAELPGSIISEMRVANIHHGEPRMLSDFFWKEYWRGS
jgi:glycosyltransferase involved in cell wall biosynthesis